tara:strand:- start:1349 stop:2089 length:741 start_codon:yes stop_codon:yes gene_type:complete
MSQNILIFGATSKIAEETARLWAIDGHRLHLVGRNATKMEPIRNDLLARGATAVEVYELDFADEQSHASFIKEIYDREKIFDICLLAHGYLGNQVEDQSSYEKSLMVIKANFLSYVSLMTPLADRMSENGTGSIVVISSVAGDRGRQSNYIYGSAKGAVSLYAQGLRNRLSSKGVNVITIKPGFVDTPMTANIPKNKLFVKPAVIAEGIVKAIASRRSCVYLPSIWFLIMTIIKLIPEFVFKKLKL